MNASSLDLRIIENLYILMVCDLSKSYKDEDLRNELTFRMIKSGWPRDYVDHDKSGDVNAPRGHEVCRRRASGTEAIR